MSYFGIVVIAISLFIALVCAESAVIYWGWNMLADLFRFARLPTFWHAVAVSALLTCISGVFYSPNLSK